MKIAFLHFAYCCGPQADNAKKILQGMKLAAQYCRKLGTDAGNGVAGLLYDAQR